MLSLCLALTGCLNPVRINENVLVCLSELDDIAVFKSLVFDVSEQYGFEYRDRSEESAENWILIGHDSELMTSGYYMNMWLAHQGRVVLTAKNLGLEAHEILIAFPRRETETELEQFKDAVVAMLDERWEVTVLEGAPGVTRNTCPPISSEGD
tara:strand:+ start:254 stop:712 length:459 start_codon:yes stop_codon:yes gene_type:complete